MDFKDHLGIIPKQYTGKNLLTESSVSFKEEAAAASFFKVAKERLLNVNEWHSVAGFVSGRFHLVNEEGLDLNGYVEKDSFLKIDIPGPGSSEGDGYDWVRVEKLKEIDTVQVRSIGFRVRPCANPDGRKNDTAHFYTDEATSTFIVTQENNKVTAQIIDLNLKPNNEASSLTDKIRNVAVGIGAIGLFSKVQWKGLAEGIVKQEND